jgi:hypothetical protein
LIEAPGYEAEGDVPSGVDVEARCKAQRIDEIMRMRM